MASDPAAARTLAREARERNATAAASNRYVTALCDAVESLADEVERLRGICHVVCSLSAVPTVRPDINAKAREAFEAQP